jgi:hypothetical protein
MALRLELDPKVQAHHKQYVSTKEASQHLPAFGQDYIGRLLREGTVDGYRTSAGHWRVHLPSLEAFYQFTLYEDAVRKERIRHERLQEKELRLLSAPTYHLRLPRPGKSALFVLLVGIITGATLYFGAQPLIAQLTPTSVPASAISSTNSSEQ